MFRSDDRQKGLRRRMTIAANADVSGVALVAPATKISSPTRSECAKTRPSAMAASWKCEWLGDDFGSLMHSSRYGLMFAAVLRR